jgi:DNA-directed RNA polymerase subunit H (RpoH/RPB5)
MNKSCKDLLLPLKMEKVFETPLTKETYMGLLARAKHFQVRMAQARGYPVLPDQEPFLQPPQTSAERLLALKDDDARMQALASTLPEGGGRPAVRVVFFVKGATLKVSDVVSQAKAHHVWVVRSSPTALAEKKRVDELVERGYKVEDFPMVQLMLDPTQTFLQPTYARLSEEDRKAFYARLRIDPSSMPIMYTSDPVARWYGWQAGDLVRCQRPGVVSLAAPSSVFYRRVAKGKAPSKVAGSDSLALYSRAPADAS